MPKRTTYKTEPGGYDEFISKSTLLIKRLGITSIDLIEILLEFSEWRNLEEYRDISRIFFVNKIQRFVKDELHNLDRNVYEINMPLKIVHYPPYTSKWNPIEHRVFPHVTRALEGVPLNTVAEAKSRIQSAKTKAGLTVTVDVIQKTYETGKKVAKDFLKNIKIKFGDSVSKLNYTISPMEIANM